MGNIYKYQFKTKEEAMFNSFLNKTIKGTASDFFKKKQKIESREESIKEELEDEYVTEMLDSVLLCLNGKNGEYVFENESLRKAMESLTENERSVVLFFFFKDLKPELISEKLNIIQNTVYIIRKRALKKLKDYMEENKNGI